jgi:RNA polymerase sigma factor for flagellar operon FliA
VAGAARGILDLVARDDGVIVGLTAAYAETSQRDALVMANVGLVRALASRLGRRLPPQVDVSDLISAGVVGLIDAASRFQPSLGVPFDAFARRRIHGAMLDSLRRLDWVPRAVRERQRLVEGAINRLRQTMGREPSDTEISQGLGVAEADYLAMLDEIRSAELAVIRPLDDDSGSRILDVFVDSAEDPHHRLERLELRRWLASALAELPDRERQILALSYGEELTLAEIGQVIGVGESRVSQLRTQAVARLRARLRDWLSAGERQ